MKNSRTLKILLIAVIVSGTVVCLNGCRSQSNTQIDTKSLLEEANRLIRYYQGNRGELKKAYEDLSEIIKREPNHAEAYVRMAELYIKDAYLSDNNFDWERAKESEQWIRKAQEISPDSAFIDGIYSYFYFAKQDYGQALELAKSAVKKDPTNPDWYFQLARVYDKETDHRGAIQSLNDALNYVKDDDYRAMVYSSLGWQYSEIEDFGNSFDMYEKSIKLRPNSPWDLNNYGAALLRAFKSKQGKKQHLDRAIEVLTNALSVMDFGMAHMNLADAYQCKARVFLYYGYTKQAKHFFEMSIKEYPSYDAVHYELGKLYEKEGNLDRAEKEYLRALFINPDYPDYQKRVEEIRQKKQKT
jgi:Tfp pilus assembly protein PilF